MPSALVRVSYSSFYLTDGPNFVVPMKEDFEGGSGLIFPLSSGAVIATGTDTGPVVVEVELCEQEPPLELVGWEECVDASVHTPLGELFVDSPMDETPDLPILSSAGPGWYRVRCMARHREPSHHHIGMEPTGEAYRFQVWPAPAAPEARHTSIWNQFSPGGQ